jgi:hypothetical protein
LHLSAQTCRTVIEVLKGAKKVSGEASAANR